MLRIQARQNRFEERALQKTFMMFLILLPPAYVCTVCKEKIVDIQCVPRGLNPLGSVNTRSATIAPN